MRERFKAFYASTIQQLISEMNKLTVSFSNVIYFGANPTPVSQDDLFMAVFDISFAPVITYEDITALNESGEFELTLSA